MAVTSALRRSRVGCGEVDGVAPVMTGVDMAYSLTVVPWMSLSTVNLCWPTRIGGGPDAVSGLSLFPTSCRRAQAGFHGERARAPPASAVAPGGFARVAGGR